jgi:hypothetical protein
MWTISVPISKPPRAPITRITFTTHSTGSPAGGSASWTRTTVPLAIGSSLWNRIPPSLRLRVVSAWLSDSTAL